MENNHKKCSNCGKILSECAAFCDECGTKFEEPKPSVCEECGSLLTPNAKFCIACGRKVLTASENREKIVKKPKAINKAERCDFVNSLVKKSIVLFVAVLILAFAFFPVATLNIEEDAIIGEEINVKFSAINSITYFFDSLNSKDEEDILDSKIYDELMDIEDEIDSWDEDESIELIEKATKLYLRMYLQSESTVFNFNYIFNLILAFAYLIFSLMAVVFATLDLLLFIFKKGRSFEKIVHNILCALPLVAISLYISICVSFMPSINSIGIGVQAKTSIGGATLASVIISFAVLIYLAVMRIFFAGKIKVRASEIVRRSLSICGAAFILFSIFMTALNINISAQFDGATKKSSVENKFDVGFYSSYNMSKDDLKKFFPISKDSRAEALIGYMDVISEYNYREVKNGEAGDTVGNLIKLGTMNFVGGSDIAPIYALIPFISVLISLLAAVILWQNFRTIVTGSKPIAALTITTRVLLIVLSVVLLVFITTSVVVFNENISVLKSAGQNYSARLSVGAYSFISLIFSVLVMSVPMKKSVEKIAASEEDFVECE